MSKKPLSPKSVLPSGKFRSMQRKAVISAVEPGTNSNSTGYPASVTITQTFRPK